ncbi:hypothetical protein Fmac_008400 [Flemingia macrophylla]|uniref:Uncharacterized protein n=1 Tax=Flemingia macrophylla TaxID=520843 RepID=A0ABD1MZP1_9FABA
MKGSNKRKTEKEKKEDEVAELLQAAQDEILLNLSHSHIARASPSPFAKTDIDETDLDLDHDLERRFQALKMKSKSVSPPQPQPQQHDLSARFDALKAKSSPSVLPTSVNSATQFGYYNQEEESEDEETQVQKLIQWAKDAARLDPSPPSNDDSDL